MASRLRIVLSKLLGKENTLGKSVYHNYPLIKSLFSGDVTKRYMKDEYFG